MAADVAVSVKEIQVNVKWWLEQRKWNEGNQPIVDAIFLKFLTDFPSYSDHHVPLALLVGIIY